MYVILRANWHGKPVVTGSREDELRYNETAVVYVCVCVCVCVCVKGKEKGLTCLNPLAVACWQALPSPGVAHGKVRLEQEGPELCAQSPHLAPERLPESH